MVKLTEIEGRKFGINAPDYIYRHYLNLPFNFSMQILSGNNLKKIMEISKSLVFLEPPSVENHIVRIRASLKYYEEKLSDFRNLMPYIVKRCNNGGQLNFVIELPETMLTIEEQRTIIKDYLCILKENIGKINPYDVLFIVITNSAFILSDAIDENVLIFNDIPDGDEKDADNEPTFGGHMLDILSRYETESLMGGLSSQIIQRIFDDANNGKEISDEVIGTIGDEYIRGVITRLNDINKRRNSRRQ